MDKRTEQLEILEQIKEFVKRRKLAPPLSLEELEEFASEFDVPEAQRKWLMIMLNNAVWRDTVAAVPFHRRIFLLPQCLRNAANCKAAVDEFGLLCEECGGCVIGPLQQEAENLGMMSLVAEGSTVVAGIIENGGADAVIGVSCLNALEKAFPYMVNHAVPGMAVPLLSDGCINTQVDVEMVREMLYLRSEKTVQPINLNDLNDTVKHWFSQPELDNLLGPAQGSAEELGREWLSGPGKRFRPYLTAAVYRCLTGEKDFPPELRKAAIAVECFHKASLIHDDIEDNDTTRYGSETLHHREGVPVALNVGDHLIGEGYRLISECGVNPVLMLKIAAAGHLALCRGQGEELEWMRNRSALTIDRVVNIFKGKTAPAFEVALAFGALCAGGDEKLCDLLSEFSTAMGIAYQIQDDIEDFLNGSDVAAGRLSVVVATGGDIAKSEQLYEFYRGQAIRSLRNLKNSELKRLLFRITGRILKPGSADVSSGPYDGQRNPASNSAFHAPEAEPPGSADVSSAFEGAPPDHENTDISLPGSADVSSASEDVPSDFESRKSWHTRGYLPHFDEPPYLQFITFRLYDAVPSDVIDEWKIKLGYTDKTNAKSSEAVTLRKRIEEFIDAGAGECFLKIPEVASMVQNALMHNDGIKYHLFAWCIMPNHVHVLIQPVAGIAVSEIVKGWKSFTGHEANKILNREGNFWMADYFDRYIRDEKHYQNVLEYVHLNPVNAGLVKSAEKWKWSSVDNYIEDNADETSALPGSGETPSDADETSALPGEKD
jgi:geranylgeranyl pyrophosphate synthase/REP element-mobilizing transposase RayT